MMNIEVKETKNMTQGLMIEEFWTRFGHTRESLISYVKNGLRYGVVYTHKGTEFHADECFTLALLETYRQKLNKEAGKELYSPFKVIRDRGIQDTRNILKVDVDDTVFDHHFPKEQAAFRKNGVQYASAGLMWTILGTEFVTETQAQEIDNSIFMPLDANDNGIEGYPSQYSDFVASMVPNWNEELSIDNQMAQAVDYCIMILKRTLAKYEAVNEARTVVQKVYDEAEDKRFIVLPKFMNWDDVLTATPDALFVIWENRGSYECQAVPPVLGSFEQRTPFLERWRGLRKQALKDASGLSLEFCHSAGFFLVADTLEDALKACKLSYVAVYPLS